MARIVVHSRFIDDRLLETQLSRLKLYDLDNQWLRDQIPDILSALALVIA